MTKLLGPCRCQGCNAWLWWARSNTRHFGETVQRTCWREVSGRRHYCPAYERAA